MSASGPDAGEDLTAVLVVPMTIFFALGLATSIARLWSRIRSEWVLRWDDYTLIFGLVGYHPCFLELSPHPTPHPLLFFSALPLSGAI
jgi:hypothetical protein